MPLSAIAIAGPPDVLAHLDQWTARKKQSRYRLIVAQLTKWLQEFEGEDVTRLYDEIYKDEQA